MSNNNTDDFSGISGVHYEENVKISLIIDKIVTTDLQSIDNILLQLSQKLKEICCSSTAASAAGNGCLLLLPFSKGFYDDSFLCVGFVHYALVSSSRSMV